MDVKLFSTRGLYSNIYWLPGKNRLIAPSANSYSPFHKIVRTVHVQSALQICLDRKMQPKPVSCNSNLNWKCLKRSTHPCKNIKVLWFGIKANQPPWKEEEHDWYGNVQFAAPANLLLQRWQYYYLVEMETTPKHTASHILVSNRDYSGYLRRYNPRQWGGPWYIDSNHQHFSLSDCVRYNNVGMNKNGHTLEFMIEVTDYGQHAILGECIISFRNHSRAKAEGVPAKCHPSRFSKQACPSPLSSTETALRFFDQHRRISQCSQVATPKLSERAEYFKRIYLEKINKVPLPSPMLPGPNQLMALTMMPPHPVMWMPYAIYCNQRILLEKTISVGNRNFYSTFGQKAGSNYYLSSHQNIKTFIRDNSCMSVIQQKSVRQSWTDVVKNTREEIGNNKPIQHIPGDVPYFQEAPLSWGIKEEQQRLQNISRNGAVHQRPKASWGEKEERFRDQQNRKNRNIQIMNRKSGVYAQNTALSWSPDHKIPNSLAWTGYHGCNINFQQPAWKPQHFQKNHNQLVLLNP